MMKKVKATHNSLSGYGLKSWWLLRFVSLLSGGRSSNLVDQYLRGVRFFDLRFAKHEGVWYGSSGLSIYKVTLDLALSTLLALSSDDDPIYFRVVCDNTFFKASSAEDLAEDLDLLLSGSTSVRPVCVAYRKPWRVVKFYPIEDIRAYRLFWE